jgi:hypothetical protein
VKKSVCTFLSVLTAISLVGCASTEGMRATGETGGATYATTTQSPTEESKADFVEVMREGETQQIPVVFVDGKVGSYTIAMDPEYFTFLPRETVDLFSYEEWPGDGAIYYAISAYQGEYDADAFIAECRAQFESQYESCTTESTTVGGYEATLVTFGGYRDAPMFCRHIYLVNCGSVAYVIKAEFTIEMYEGLYAVMRALFDTFTVK